MGKFLLLIFLLAACGSSPLEKGKTIVKVGDTEITEGYLEFLGEMNPNIERQLASELGRRQIIENLVEQELLYQAAKREDVNNRRKVRAKIDFYKKVVIAQAFVEDKALEKARRYYKENTKEFEKLRLAHILIGFATPEELKRGVPKGEKRPLSEKQALKKATEIVARLEGEEDFAALAAEFSDDIRSKERGGDLGLASRNDPRLTRRGYQPLLEKAFEMKAGEIGGPVKTATGYHVITVKSPPELVAFEEVQNQILFKTRGEIRHHLLESLKEKGKIRYGEGNAPKKPAADAEKRDESPHPHPHP